MSDAEIRPDDEDDERINVSEDYEVRDWAAKFGVGEKALRDAVARVGNRSADVQKELGGKMTMRSYKLVLRKGGRDRELRVTSPTEIQAGAGAVSLMRPARSSCRSRAG